MKEKPQYQIGQSTELRTASCTMQRLQRPSLALMEFDAFLQCGQLIYIFLIKGSGKKKPSIDEGKGNTLLAYISFF